MASDDEDRREAMDHKATEVVAHDDAEHINRLMEHVAG